jgi:glycosyltransferase involved in cell wall biosynthesis
LKIKNRVIIWCDGIDNLLPKSVNNDPKMVGGINVQLFMWATTFNKNNWEVYSFTDQKENANKLLNDIYFIHFPQIQYINPIISVLFSFYIIARIRPKLILLSGATRDLFYVRLFAKFWKAKLILRFASDSDLQPGKELINRYHDKILFRLGIKITSDFIVQNENQAVLLKNNYSKYNYTKIPNIWIFNSDKTSIIYQKDIILWVSNFRELKRPHWFLRLAKEKTNYHFIMVGNSIDRNLFNKCKKESKDIYNLKFMGGVSFSDTFELFLKARLFVCTSTIEGFPNTFLQAWLNECPVITTFDPSNIIANENLGIYCKNYDEVVMAFDKFEDQNYYEKTQSNIRSYFRNHHDGQVKYEKLVRKFNLV